MMNLIYIQKWQQVFDLVAVMHLHGNVSEKYDFIFSSLKTSFNLFLHFKDTKGWYIAI